MIAQFLQLFYTSYFEMWLWVLIYFIIKQHTTHIPYHTLQLVNTQTVSAHPTHHRPIKASTWLYNEPSAIAIKREIIKDMLVEEINSLIELKLYLSTPLYDLNTGCWLCFILQCYHNLSHLTNGIASTNLLALTNTLKVYFQLVYW